MNYIYTKIFANIDKNDVSLVGGKGAFLGQLTNYEIPVPPGFVISTNAFSEFLNTNSLFQIMKEGFSKLMSGNLSVEDFSFKITEEILNGVIPLDIVDEIQNQFKILDASLVAVRSSATVEDNVQQSWAGQLESYLNITSENLLQSVKKCWASLFSKRALEYGLKSFTNTEAVYVAVVIQKMIESEISGVAFSVNPVTENRDEIIIEAGYGLGEAIVQGQITPDNYIVNKSDFSIVTKFLSPQSKGIYRLENGSTGWKPIDPSDEFRQKLTEQNIIILAKKIKAIETLFEFPCDVEWVFEKNHFYFVQCRPITTLL